MQCGSTSSRLVTSRQVPSNLSEECTFDRWNPILAGEVNPVHNGPYNDEDAIATYSGSNLAVKCLNNSGA